MTHILRLNLNVQMISETGCSNEGILYSPIDREAERQFWAQVNQDLDILFGGDSKLRAQLFTPDRAVDLAALISENFQNEYISQESAEGRLRLLCGDIFSIPYLTIGPIISPTRRSSRTEGSLSVPEDQDAFIQFANILAESGYTKEELVRMAARMNNKGHISSDVVQQVEAIISRGDSSERANQTLDTEHLVPHSQGGKLQFPVHPVVHFYMHARRADIARECLEKILEVRYSRTSDIPNDRLEQLLSFFTAAYIVNVIGAEATRNTSIVKDSFGRDAITEDIDLKLGELQTVSDVEKLVSSAVGTMPEWFGAEDLELAKTVAVKLSADKEHYNPATLAPKESEMVSKLDALARLEELAQAKAEINTAFGKQRSPVIQAFVKSIDEKITRLRADYRDNSRIDIEEIRQNKELYAILTASTQDPLQKNLLSRICLPPMVGGLRLDWKVQLNIDPWYSIYPFRFVQQGSFIRRIADILGNPVPYKVGEIGFWGQAEIVDPEKFPTMEYLNHVYPDLRVQDLIGAHIHNEIVNNYLRIIGFSEIDSREVQKFLEPSEYDIAPASELQSVDQLAERIVRWISNKDKIGLIGDCDQDGFLSVVVSKFVLEKISETELETAIQTRTQGHGVRMADILNLISKGCTKFLIHDTGSGVGDVLVFQTAHDGIANSSVVDLFEASKKSGKARIAMLEDFGRIMDEVDDFRSLEKRDRSVIKSAVTRFTRSLEREFAGKELTVDNLSSRIAVFLGREITIKGEKVLIGSLPFVNTFFCGNQDIEFGITDHHTASIQGVQFLQSCAYVEMVNPQWVKKGSESNFVEEMKAALATNNAEIVKTVQMKYVNSRSDIVGTVVASKVMERVLQIYGSDSLATTDHPLRTHLKPEQLSGLLSSDATQLFTLPNEEREARLRDISNSLSQEAKASRIELGKISSGFNIEMDVSSSWQRRGSIRDIKERVFAARAFFVADVEQEINRVMNARSIDRANAVDILFKAMPNETRLIDGLLTSYSRDHHLSINNIDALWELLKTNNMETLMPETSVDSEVKSLESRYWEAVSKLSLSEMRFYLSYEQLLPQNFYEKNPVEKLEEINRLMTRVAEQLGVLSVVGGDGECFEFDVSKYAKETRLVGGDLYNLRRDLSAKIRKFYREHGRPKGVRGSELSMNTAIRNLWAEHWGTAYEAAAFSNGEKRILECYGRNGVFDILQIEFARAIAQVGDGGYVGMAGLEGRAIVKRGQRLVDQRIEEEKVRFVSRSIRRSLGNEESKISLWRENRRRLLKKSEPALMDMLRAGLDGEHLDSITLLLTRVLTHQMSAGINAFFRANAIKGEDDAARANIYTDLNLFINGARTEQEKRDRARIVVAHRRAIEDRERMMQKVLQKVEAEKLYKRDLIVVEVSGGIIDPTAGFRGLIAGQLASLYGKPTIVVNISGNGGKKGFQVGLSARLPGSGNRKCDIAFRSEEYKPTNPSKLRMETCGGHPEAAGGSGIVFAKDRDEVLEIVEATFAPGFNGFQQTFPNGGIIDYRDTVRSIHLKLQEEGLIDFDEYVSAVDPFSVLRDVAETSNKILHPTGSDVPYLRVRMTVKVLAIGRSKTGDDRDYCYVKVEDEFGHKGVFRSFKGEIDWKKVKTGHFYQIVIEPRLRSRPRRVARFNPRVKLGEHNLNTHYYAGYKTEPTLDIVELNPVDEISEI